MKIDLHCHTKKTKSGETEKRTINPDKFADILSKNNVGIVSCTNHNNFSINDYALFSDASSKKGIVLWPGIELDVVVNNEKGHVIFICNPNKVDIFDAKVKSILGASSPDSFEKPIECVLEEFAD